MTGSSGTGGSAVGLSNYLSQPDKQEWREVRNLPGRSRGEDARLMDELAETSRAEEPIYHMSLNYADGDNPSKEQMLADADRVLEELELSDHQAVIVSHHDTDHDHVHIMVNRVHQNKPRAHNVWRDRTRMKNILGRIEEDRGYQKVSHVHEWKDKELRKGRSKGEFMRLRKQGFERMPLADKVQLYNVDQTISNAKNWHQLQGELANIDLTVTTKGRGGVIKDLRTEMTYKLSRVNRDHSFGKLQDRFGTFNDYQQSLKVSRTVGKSIPDRKIGQATARIVQEGYGGKAISKGAKKQFKSAIKSAYSAQKSVAKIGKMAGSLANGSPALSPMKYAYKAGKGIIKQVNRERDRGRGLSM